MVALALTHYVNLMGLFKTSIASGNLPLASFKLVFGSLPLHCAIWNAEIQVFSSVLCTHRQAMSGDIYTTAFRVTLSLTFSIGRRVGARAASG